MNRVVALASVGIAAILGGCASLEQAPLVYASTQQMGVVVSGGKPENPAPSIVVGYNGADVAFVPVAIAKRCPKNNAEHKCENINYNVYPIVGSNQLTGQMLLDAQTAEKFQDTINTNNMIISNNSGILSDLRGQLLEKARLPDLQKQFAALQPPVAANTTDPTAAPPPPQPKEQIEQAAKLQAEIDRIKAINDQQLGVRIKELEDKNKSAADTVVENEKLLRQLLGRDDHQTGDNKRDAFSVYGSFNGSAKGTKDGAGLTLGKVFSTGIAAQNLTQGIAKGTRSSAVAQCLNAIKDLIPTLDPKPTPEGINLLLASCRPPEKE